MNIISAYISGLKSIFSNIKLWLLLYVFNVLFAILLAYPLSGFLGDKLGNTLAADKLLEEFDFAIVTDFFREHGDLIGLMMNQSIVALVLYLLLSVFLVGGILTAFKNKKEAFHFGDFWNGCANYFWRMLRLTIYFLIIQLLLLFLFFTLFSTLTAGGLERFHNETEIVLRGLIILPFYLFFATIFFMIQDYTKIHIVETNKNILFKPIWQSVQLVFKNFSKVFFLYLLNLLTFGILFLIYCNLDGGTAILLIFLIGQIFVLARIGTKLLNLASATDLYQQL